MFRLQVPDARFGGGAVFYPSPERSRCPASTSFVHMYLADLLPDHALDLSHLRPQRLFKRFPIDAHPQLNKRMFQVDQLLQINLKQLALRLILSLCGRIGFSPSYVAD
jgi:hypothetical protein